MITVFSCSTVFVRARGLISVRLFENENSGRKGCKCIIGSNFGKKLIEREGWVEGGNPIEKERESVCEREREREREKRERERERERETVSEREGDMIANIMVQSFNYQYRLGFL